MDKAVFICSETGEQVFVETWKSKVNSLTKEVEYFESGYGWRPLVNPKTGAKLIKSEHTQIQMTSVKTETASR